MLTNNRFSIISDELSATIFLLSKFRIQKFDISALIFVMLCHLPVVEIIHLLKNFPSLHHFTYCLELVVPAGEFFTQR